jgi:hypothetical protein
MIEQRMSRLARLHQSSNHHNESQMENSLRNFNTAILDIETLLSLSRTKTGSEHKGNILRSAVVLMVAAWEQFIEQLAVNSVTTLTNRLRNPNTLPEIVRQNVAMNSVPEDRDRRHRFSEAVWGFSDKGWKNAYVLYCKRSVARINSASSENVIKLYKSIFGIEDIKSFWTFKNLSSVDSARKLDDLVDMRHDIAHGANTRSHELTETYVVNLIEFIRAIASLTDGAVYLHADSLWSEQAITYSLKAPYYPTIITLAAKRDRRILTLKQIKMLGTSEQGNHNKLCYEPWGLLEKIDGKTRRVTDRLMDFYEGKIDLPMNIFVFDNGEAVPATNTPYISFSELNAMTQRATERVIA